MSTDPTSREESRRPDASMTLITSMLERPLDPGYAAAAERRTQAGLEASTGWRRPALLVWLLVIGLVVGISAASLRSRDGQRAEARAGLVEQIDERQEQVEAQSARARELQREIDAAGARVAGGPGDVQSLRVAAGLVAVDGPGLRVTLDDAPGASTGENVDPRGGRDDEGRVLSRDLQIVVNGLWDAGAEAVAVNGQRLTSRSAIRFAGKAILVNFRPLTRPYVVEAVGDPTGMQTAFATSSAGTYLTSLRQNFQVQTSTTTQERIVLPSAVAAATRYARTPGSAPSEPSPTSSPSSASTSSSTSAPTSSSTPSSAPTQEDPS